jgi:hypothetical protein
MCKLHDGLVSYEQACRVVIENFLHEYFGINEELLEEASAVLFAEIQALKDREKAAIEQRDAYHQSK